MNDPSRYDGQIVVVTVATIIETVVVAQLTGLKADQFSTVVASVLLLGQRFLRTNIQNDETVQLLRWAGLDQLSFVEQLRTVANLFGCK